MSGFRPRFFIDDGELGARLDAGDGEEAELVLSPDDSHHALRVLRLKAGDPCEVVVGAAVYAASVGGATEPVKVRLEKRLEGLEAGARYRVQVGLAQALTRPALLDQVLEKGTEVGTSFFTIFPAAGSPRIAELAKASRLERWQRIVVEAAKQSKQTRIPTVELAESFDAAQERLKGQGRVSLALEPSSDTDLAEAQELAGLSSTPNGIALWVGPESGWSDDELEGFAAAGIDGARMGQSVLRAETAGPVAVAVTRLVIGDW